MICLSLFGPDTSLWQTQEALELLRFPMSETSASFVGRIDRYRMELIRFFGIYYNFPVDLQTAPKHMECYLHGCWPIFRTEPLRSLRPVKSAMAHREIRHPPDDVPVESLDIPVPEIPPEGAQSLRSFLTVVAARIFHHGDRRARFFSVDKFIKLLADLVVRTKDDIVFRVVDDDVTRILINVELLSLSRFTAGSNGKYSFSPCFLDVIPNYPFDSFCELVEHFLELHHLVGEEGGACMPLDQLDKALFGKRYRARYNGTEQLDIYFQRTKFRQTHPGRQSGLFRGVGFWRPIRQCIVF
jgi:hypothetical protein